MPLASAIHDSRLHHLDALRSAAILYGVLVHTATLGVGWPLNLISEVSIYFRMGTFFLISGFFSAMVLRKFGTSIFLKKRAISLLIPLLCGAVLLNPVTNWMVWNWNNPALSLGEYINHVIKDTLPDGQGVMVWHLHLWFLVSLSFYALTAPLMAAIVRQFPKAAGGLSAGLSALPAWACVIAVATICASCSLASRVFYEVVLERPLVSMGWSIAGLVRNTLYYWPMFLTGMAVFSDRNFAARFQTLSLPAISIGLIFLIIQSQFIFPKSGLVWEVVDLFSRAFLTVSIIAALMALFSRFLSRPGFLSRSSDSIYSIYILHYIVIYLIAHVLRALGFPHVTLFWFVAGLTVASLFVIHRFAIRPSAVLSLMFNGKPLPAVQRAMVQS
jgi:glucan biosynthesis protein C